jgi:hypothetical protein
MQNTTTEDVKPTDVLPEAGTGELQELTVLKDQAARLGITYHPAIGLDKLRDKVNLAVRAGKSESFVEDDYDDVPLLTEPVHTDTSGTAIEDIIAGYLEREAAALTPAQKRNQAIKDANKLVRIRINCMNPAKRDWSGEMLSVSNSVVGTYKKFVPFSNAEGWHVPHIIVQALQEKMCQIFVNGTNAQGVKIKRAQLIKEFSIEIMDPLTDLELKELAQRQLMAAGA